MDWFASQTKFTLRALGPHLVLPEGLKDGVALRGVLLADALRLWPLPKVCPQNRRHKVLLVQEQDRNCLRFRLRCSHNGADCYRSCLCPAGLLSKVHLSLWLPFLCFVNGMRLNYRWTKIMTDMDSVFGVKNKRTFQAWRALYQDALTQYLEKNKGLIIGSSPGDVVVSDERSTAQTKTATKNIVRLPGRTVHKFKRPASTLHRPAAVPLHRPASVMKNIFNKNKGTPKDACSGGRWLFAAMLVGNQEKRYTHANGKKQFSFKVLPTPALAPDKKSRGTASMKKVQRASHQKPVSYMIRGRPPLLPLPYWASSLPYQSTTPLVGGFLSRFSFK